MFIKIKVNFTALVLLVLNTLVISSGEEQKYQRTCRDLHNQYRKKHHVAPLNYNEDVNQLLCFMGEILVNHLTIINTVSTSFYLIL